MEDNKEHKIPSSITTHILDTQEPWFYNADVLHHNGTTYSLIQANEQNAKRALHIHYMIEEHHEGYSREKINKLLLVLDEYKNANRDTFIILKNNASSCTEIMAFPTQLIYNLYIDSMEHRICCVANNL